MAHVLLNDRFAGERTMKTPGKSRRSARGVTVFELSAVTATVTVLAIGAFAFIRPHFNAQAQDAARKDANKILNAAEEWRRENGKGCPTISQLIYEKQLDESARTDDPWGERFRVRCSEDDLSVVSVGKDHKPGTPDDIHVGKS